MDDYPPGSLDHSVPFLLTLGTCTDTPYDAKLSHALKEQAILIRSELPALDSDQARALMRYMQDRDASNSPCNARNETTRKYRFHIKSAERVRICPTWTLTAWNVGSRSWKLRSGCVNSPCCYPLAAPAYPTASSPLHQPRPPYYIPPTLP